jgi:hypothetical protein
MIRFSFIIVTKMNEKRWHINCVFYIRNRFKQNTFHKNFSSTMTAGTLPAASPLNTKFRSPIVLIEMELNIFTIKI